MKLYIVSKNHVVPKKTRVHPKKTKYMALAPEKLIFWFPVHNGR